MAAHLVAVVAAAQEEAGSAAANAWLGITHAWLVCAWRLCYVYDVPHTLSAPLQLL